MNQCWLCSPSLRRVRDVQGEVPAPAPDSVDGAAPAADGQARPPSDTGGEAAAASTPVAAGDSGGEVGPGLSHTALRDHPMHRGEGAAPRPPDTLWFLKRCLDSDEAPPGARAEETVPQERCALSLPPHFPVVVSTENVTLHDVTPRHDFLAALSIAAGAPRAQADAALRPVTSPANPAVSPSPRCTEGTFCRAFGDQPRLGCRPRFKSAGWCAAASCGPAASSHEIRSSRWTRSPARRRAWPISHRRTFPGDRA